MIQETITSRPQHETTRTAEYNSLRSVMKQSKRHNERDAARVLVNAEPYVLADFDKAVKPWPRKDASFTSLGIVLLELCFDERFTGHKLWHNYPGKENDSLIRLAIAQNWADRVAEEASEDYALAVKWALKEAPADTHTDSWRADFAQHVVQPLQRCCEFLRPRK